MLGWLIVGLVHPERSDAEEDAAGAWTTTFKDATAATSALEERGFPSKGCAAIGTQGM